MPNKLALFTWFFAFVGLAELVFLPVWESLLILHIGLAGMTLLVILTRPNIKNRDIFGLGISVLNGGRKGLTVLAIALPWMIIALFVIPLAEYNQFESLYTQNASIFSLAGLLIYPFIPILLSPRREYHDLLYRKLRLVILEPRVLEEFLIARNDEKKMQEFTSTYFPEINSLYEETKDSLVTLEVFSLFRNLETRLKEDPGFAPILENFQKP